nr:hypothetical protein [Actinomycetales bacterium]
MRAREGARNRPPETPKPDKATAKRLRRSGAVVHAALADGRWLGVAIDHLLVLGEEDVEFSRPWTDAESAVWDGDSRTLTVRWVDGSEPSAFRTATDDVFDAVTAVRERITTSQVHVEIMGTSAGDVRALIRRGAGGQLFSQLLARGPLTEDERRRADELERTARSAVGLVD